METGQNTLAVLRAPMTVGGQRLDIDDASLGIFLYPQVGADVTSLLGSLSVGSSVSRTFSTACYSSMAKKFFLLTPTVACSDCDYQKWASIRRNSF